MNPVLQTPYYIASSLKQEGGYHEEEDQNHQNDDSTMTMMTTRSYILYGPVSSSSSSSQRHDSRTTIPIFHTAAIPNFMDNNNNSNNSNDVDIKCWKQLKEDYKVYRLIFKLKKIIGMLTMLLWFGMTTFFLRLGEWMRNMGGGNGNSSSSGTEMMTTTTSRNELYENGQAVFWAGLPASFICLWGMIWTMNMLRHLWTKHFVQNIMTRNELLIRYGCKVTYERRIVMDGNCCNMKRYQGIMILQQQQQQVKQHRDDKDDSPVVVVTAQQSLNTNNNNHNATMIV